MPGIEWKIMRKLEKVDACVQKFEGTEEEKDDCILDCIFKAGEMYGGLTELQFKRIWFYILLRRMQREFWKKYPNGIFGA